MRKSKNDRKYCKAKIKASPGQLSNHSTGKLIDVLNKTIGAKIINAGFIEENVEGGITIDYQHDNKKAMRLVIGYTDLGEWVEYNGPVAEKK